MQSQAINAQETQGWKSEMKNMMSRLKTLQDQKQKVDEKLATSDKNLEAIKVEMEQLVETQVKEKAS